MHTVLKHPSNSGARLSSKQRCPCTTAYVAVTTNELRNLTNDCFTLRDDRRFPGAARCGADGVDAFVAG